MRWPAECGVHIVEDRIQLVPCRTARLKGRAISNLLLPTLQSEEYIVGENIHIHAERMQARSLKIGIYRRRNDLDDLDASIC